MYTRCVNSLYKGQDLLDRHLSVISSITVTLMPFITIFILLTFSLIRHHLWPAGSKMSYAMSWNIQVLSEDS